MYLRIGVYPGIGFTVHGNTQIFYIVSEILQSNFSPLCPIFRMSPVKSLKTLLGRYRRREEFQNRYRIILMKRLKIFQSYGYSE